MKLKIKPKSLIIKLVVMAIISCVFLLAFVAEAEDTNLYLDSIDYKATMNKDGSMDVVETWDIKINETNTLFKTFTISSFKYGDITNVKVKDLTENKNLTQIYEEMYHVTTDCYYGLKTNSSTFEIAWGTGMEHSRGRKKYEVSYKVENVATGYQDCEEVYWQFLGKGQNSVPAGKVTGTITLPEEVEDINNLLVFGHGQISRRNRKNK